MPVIYLLIKIHTAKTSVTTDKNLNTRLLLKRPIIKNSTPTAAKVYTNVIEILNASYVSNHSMIITKNMILIYKVIFWWNRREIN